LVNLKIIEAFTYLSLKLVLFYIWNILKLIGVNEEEIINLLKVEYEPYTELIYGDDMPNISDNDMSNIDGSDGYILWSEENKIKAGRIIKNIDFYKYSEFYEQLYLYNHVWKFYYYDNKGINYNRYEHIDKFVNIFKHLSVYFDIEKRSELNSYRVSLGSKENKLVSTDFIDLKYHLLNEWRKCSKDLSLENFYEKNYEVLREINTFVNSINYVK
jgi:hypothetical protein